MNSKLAEKWNKSLTHIEHPAGTVGRESLVSYIRVLAPEYLLPFQWIPVRAPIHSLPSRSVTVKTCFILHQSVATEAIRNVTLHFPDRLGATSLTILMCEQN